METKKETNCLIDMGRKDDEENEKHKVRYFTAWRQFLLELEKLEIEEIGDLFKKYNIYFLECDNDFPSINIDFPEEGKEIK